MQFMVLTATGHKSLYQLVARDGTGQGSKIGLAFLLPLIIRRISLLYNQFQRASKK